MCWMPPATTTSQAPSEISPAPAVTEVSAPAHIRSTAKPGTLFGMPASSATSRPSVRPWSPTCAVAARELAHDLDAHVVGARAPEDALLAGATERGAHTVHENDFRGHAEERRGLPSVRSEPSRRDDASRSVVPDEPNRARAADEVGRMHLIEHEALVDRQRDVRTVLESQLDGLDPGSDRAPEEEHSVRARRADLLGGDAHLVRRGRTAPQLRPVPPGVIRIVQRVPCALGAMRSTIGRWVRTVRMTATVCAGPVGLGNERRPARWRLRTRPLPLNTVTSRIGSFVFTSTSRKPLCERVKLRRAPLANRIRTLRAGAAA